MMLLFIMLIAHRSYEHEHIYEHFYSLFIQFFSPSIANMHQVNDNLLQYKEIVRKKFEVKLNSFAIRAV